MKKVNTLCLSRPLPTCKSSTTLQPDVGSVFIRFSFGSHAPLPYLSRIVSLCLPLSLYRFFAPSARVTFSTLVICELPLSSSLSSPFARLRPHHTLFIYCGHLTAHVLQSLSQTLSLILSQKMQVQVPPLSAIFATRLQWGPELTRIILRRNQGVAYSPAPRWRSQPTSP